MSAASEEGLRDTSGFLQPNLEDHLVSLPLHPFGYKQVMRPPRYQGEKLDSSLKLEGKVTFKRHLGWVLSLQNKIYNWELGGKIWWPPHNMLPKISSYSFKIKNAFVTIEISFAHILSFLSTLLNPGKPASCHPSQRSNRWLWLSQKDSNLGHWSIKFLN